MKITDNFIALNLFKINKINSLIQSSNFGSKFFIKYSVQYFYSASGIFTCYHSIKIMQMQMPNILKIDPQFPYFKKE